MGAPERERRDKKEDDAYVKIAIGMAFLAVFVVFGVTVTFIASIWFLIPAAALIGSGVQNLIHQRRAAVPAPDNKERELLSAIRDSGGSITPAEAAMETSLTVREADKMLSELASGGHLQVESRDGTLYYVLPGRRSELGS